MSATISRTRLRISCLLVLVTTLGFAAGLIAEVATMLRMLKGYEWRLDAIQLSTLPVSAVDDLLTIASTDGHPAYLRSRAQQVLVKLVAGPLASDLAAVERVWQFLQGEFALSAGVESRRLADALGNGFALTRPDQLVEILGPYLESDDIHMRLIVARWLNQLATPTARALVSAYRDKAAVAGQPWEKEALGITVSRQN